jgi:hypothetical protein
MAGQTTPFLFNRATTCVLYSLKSTVFAPGYMDVFAKMYKQLPALFNLQNQFNLQYATIFFYVVIIFVYHKIHAILM